MWPVAGQKWHVAATFQDSRVVSWVAGGPGKDAPRRSCGIGISAATSACNRAYESARRPVFGTDGTTSVSGPMTAVYYVPPRSSSRALSLRTSSSASRRALVSLSGLLLLRRQQKLPA